MSEERTGQQHTSRIANEIARRITQGKLGEGDILPKEVELAAEFNVSRTSIREALSLLKAKGLIESRQKLGTRVLPRVSWNMLDGDLLEWTWSQRPVAEFANRLNEVRRIVEPEACALCAKNGTDSDLAAIERAYHEMDAAGGDVSAFAEPDLRFHRGILIGTGNEFLVAFGAIVEAALRMSFELSTKNPDAPRRALSLHRAVLDRMWSRDADGARQAMLRLLDLTESNIMADLAQRDADNKKE